jgi:hypothetical protein
MNKSKITFSFCAFIIATCIFLSFGLQAQNPNLTRAQKLITLSGEDFISQGIAKTKQSFQDMKRTGNE